MAGTAKTEKFMLGTATVMVGQMSEVFDLNPTEHSIGLVKNFQMQSQPGFTDLTQGVKNQLVYSVHTSNEVNASCEVYEFTSKNLAYALGLNGSGVSSQTTATTVATQADGTGTPFTDLEVASATGLVAGDSISISIGSDDNIIVRKIQSIASTTITLDKSVSQLVPVGAAVKKINVLRVGSKDLENSYYAAKVVGRLVNGDEIVLLLPKIKVVAGFTLAFNTNDYGNLPFEMKLFDSVDTDPFYSDFANEQAKLYVR